MNKSFHYYCIRVLAEKSGFSARDAQTIAYASQYTDDSTEHGSINISNIPGDYDYPRLNGNIFDPICTAHSAKSCFIKVFKWAKFYLKADVQRKILIPFHFLPSEELSPGNEAQFDFVVNKNSTLANMVVENALESFSGHSLDYSLIKLGIALHTYADTWAHADFTGRHSSVENDIEKIKIKKGGEFKKVNPLQGLTSYAAPDVGHAEAGSIPDSTDSHWKAKYANKDGEINHDNADDFLEAAEKIYGKLTTVSQSSPIDWNEFSPQIEHCLKKHFTWENTFQDIDFNYSHFTWRANALKGDSIEWDDFDDEDDFHKLNFEYTGADIRWLLFHKAAYEQRIFLAEKIPSSWIST